MERFLVFNIAAVILVSSLNMNGSCVVLIIHSKLNENSI